jgi:hypothetical protein
LKHSKPNEILAISQKCNPTRYLNPDITGNTCVILTSGIESFHVKKGIESFLLLITQAVLYILSGGTSQLALPIISHTEHIDVTNA